MFPGIEIDFDEQTGAKAYAIAEGGQPYVVGIVLSRTTDVRLMKDRLSRTARSGAFEFGNETQFLSDQARERLEDSAFRSQVFDDVRRDHGIGPYVFEAKAVPVDQRSWQLLRRGLNVPLTYRVFEHVAVENGWESSVRYAIAPEDDVSVRAIGRGRREAENVGQFELEWFLEWVVGNEIGQLERDPKKASAPVSYGTSDVFERSLAERLAELN